jgi:hypothetical protein
LVGATSKYRQNFNGALTPTLSHPEKKGSVLSIDTYSLVQVVKPVGHVCPCPHL